jgi:hypothetical protein
MAARLFNLDCAYRPLRSNSRRINQHTILDSLAQTANGGGSQYGLKGESFQDRWARRHHRAFSRKLSELFNSGVPHPMNTSASRALKLVLGSADQVLMLLTNGRRSLSFVSKSRIGGGQGY